MKIALAADHAAFREKDALKAQLAAAGHEVLDFGTDGDRSVDYPDHSIPAARAVGSGAAERGILLCGTGIGQCMVANKVPGVRAAVVWDRTSAQMSRMHNDANVACFGARHLGLDAIRDLLHVWLDTEFEAGRHARRIGKVNALDGALDGG